MPDVTRKRWNFGFSVVRPFRIELQAMKKKTRRRKERACGQKGRGDKRERKKEGGRVRGFAHFGAYSKGVPSKPKIEVR